MHWFPWVVIVQEERKSWMEAIHPGSTSQPQVPKPLALYEVIPDDLFDEELCEEPEPVPRPPEETELYIDLPELPPHPPPLPAADSDEDIYDVPPLELPQPNHQDLYMPLDSELYESIDYFDLDEQLAAEDPPTPMSASGSEYHSLLTTDHTDEDSYMGLIYEPPLPPKPLPPPKPRLLPPPLRRPPPPSQPPLPRVEPPPLPVQPPPPMAKDHSSLAQRALQYLDPAQLDIMIQMLQKLKGEPGPTTLPHPASPLPMKKDDEFYEDIYDLSEAASIHQKELPPPPLPPDRLVHRKQQFIHEANPFRKQSSRRKPAKESNLGRSECSAFRTLLSAAVCLLCRAAAEEECNNDF